MLLLLHGTCASARVYILSLSCWLTFHCVTYAQVRSVLDAAAVAVGGY
jgi:hypothetical protein